MLVIIPIIRAIINLIRNVDLTDEEQKQNTRGIYICKDSKCINKLLKAKDITKCVKIKVTVESVKELLRNLGE